MLRTFGDILSQQGLFTFLELFRKKSRIDGEKNKIKELEHFRYLVFDPVNNSTLEVVGKGGVNNPIHISTE